MYRIRFKIKSCSIKQLPQNLKTMKQLKKNFPVNILYYTIHYNFKVNLMLKILISTFKIKI